VGDQAQANHGECLAGPTAALELLGHDLRAEGKAPGDADRGRGVEAKIMCLT